MGEKFCVRAMEGDFDFGAASLGFLHNAGDSVWVGRAYTEEADHGAETGATQVRCIDPEELVDTFVGWVVLHGVVK